MVTGTLAKTKVTGEEQCRINAKKVWVNAQVTGTIAFIEMILTILYVIMIALYRSTHFANLLIVMVLYDVILPYSFLMNTSHNKKRIVEFGWKNVFKNIILRSEINSVEDITKETDKKTCHEFEKESKNEENINFEVSTIVLSSKNNLDNNFVADHNMMHDEPSSSKEVENPEPDFALLSVSSLPRQRRNDETLLQLPRQRQNDEPSSSKEVENPEPDFALLSVSSLPRQRRNDETLLQLVLDLTHFEKDENIYLKCIERLVKFQDSIKAGKIYSHEISKDNLIPNRYKGAKNKCQKSKGKRVRSPKNVPPGNNESHNLFSKDTKDENHIVSIQTPSLTGDRKVRNSKRKRIIDQIKNSTGNEKLCYDLIENLIDLEESFVSGC